MPPPTGLVIYPATGWNSFATQVDIDAWIESFTPDNTWKNLSPEAKEAYTLQGAFFIKMCPNITLPETAEDDLVTAQALNAFYAYNRGGFVYDPNARAVIREKVGDLEVEYDANYKSEQVDMPPNAVTLLRQYGCTPSSTSGFSQSNILRG